MTSSAEELGVRRANAIPRGIVSAHSGISIVRAKGADVWDADGKRYIDFAAGIAIQELLMQHGDRSKPPSIPVSTSRPMSNISSWPSA